MLERTPSLLRTGPRQDRSASFSDDGGITPAELFAFVRRHLVAIAGCMVLGLVLGGLYATSQEPSFTAQTQILIDPKTPEILSTEGQAMETSLDTAEVESQMTLLRSEMIANMVIDELDLTHDPEFQGQKRSRLEMLLNTGTDLVLRLGLLDASRVYDWRDRNLARIAPTPTEDAAGGLAAGAAGGRAAGAAEEDIDGRRLALAIFQGKLGVSRISVSYVIEIAFNSRDPDRAAQIANATADAYLREQILSKIAAMQQGNEWLEGRLNELRRKLNVATQAAQLFRARHDYSIREAPPSDIASITSGTAAEDAPEEPTLEELEATADTYRKLYGSVLEAFTSSMQHQSYPYSAIRVITPAAAPFAKSRPRTKITLVFGGLVGLLFGVGAAFARESLDGSIRSGRQIRADIGAECLVEVPRIRSWGNEQRGLANAALHPGSPFADALGRLKTAIRINAKADGSVAVGITSAFRGEGRTVIASNLGLVCIGAGYRTLVVDGDPAGATLSRCFARPPEVDGNPVPTRPDLVSGLPLDAERWFDLLPGPFGDRPGERASPSVPASRLKAFEPPYDVIIVDLPPIEEAIDTMPTLPALDFIVLVAEWGSTPVDAVTEAVRVADAVGIPLLGVVMTKVPRSAR